MSSQQPKRLTRRLLNSPPWASPVFSLASSPAALPRPQPSTQLHTPIPPISPSRNLLEASNPHAFRRSNGLRFPITCSRGLHEQARIHRSSPLTSNPVIPWPPTPSPGQPRLPRSPANSFLCALLLNYSRRSALLGTVPPSFFALSSSLRLLSSFSQPNPKSSGYPSMSQFHATCGGEEHIRLDALAVACFLVVIPQRRGGTYPTHPRNPNNPKNLSIVTSLPHIPRSALPSRTKNTASNAHRSHVPGPKKSIHLRKDVSTHGKPLLSHGTRHHRPSQSQSLLLRPLLLDI